MFMIVLFSKATAKISLVVYQHMNEENVPYMHKEFYLVIKKN